MTNTENTGVLYDLNTHAEMPSPRLSQTKKYGDMLTVVSDLQSSKMRLSASTLHRHSVKEEGLKEALPNIVP